MPDLTSTQRREMRAAAHPLHPVVAIGHHGLTAAVLHEIDVALLAHELIKVRVFGDDRAERGALMARICAALACAPVQQIGKLLVLWRPNPEKSKRAASKVSGAPTGKSKKPGPAARAGGKTPRARDGKTSTSPRSTRRQRETDAAAAPAPRGDQSRRRERAALPEVPRAPQSRRRRRVVKS